VSKPEIVDLTNEPSSRTQSAAFYALKGLRRGEKVVLVTAREPSLLMQSIDLQLRHILAWTIVEADGKWQVEVSHRADTGPRDVVDLLSREHNRLDGLLAQTLQCLNRGDAAAAAALLRRFVLALERHMSVEDEGAAGAFAMPEAIADGDPLAVMLREHGEIRQQLSAIENCLAAPEATELGVFCAILSGTLAKHEQREESNLFPQWRAAWARKPPAEREDIMARVEAALGAPNDER
jgi:hemerythrin-like domain-containing protein